MAKIDDFFAGTRYVTIGIDPGDGAYGSTLFMRLRLHGRRVFVVLPDPSEAALHAAGETYKDLQDVPIPIDGVVIDIEEQPAQVMRAVKTAIEKGIKRIWIDNRCNVGGAVQYARQHGIEVVDNACPLLALEPTSVHWIHRKVLDLTGKTPVAEAKAA
jgi:predicted CoA-binding protein